MSGRQARAVARNVGLNTKGGLRPPFVEPVPAARYAADERDHVAQRREPRERLALELAHALARQVELVADRLERPRLAVEPEAELEDPPLALGERVERLADALPAERLLGLVERVGGLAVGEQVAELALVVRADRLVQRDRRVRGADRLVDVLDRQARRLGELVLRRLAAELDLEPPRRARQLLLALDDVDGDADRPRVVRDGALHRLADPPGRVRGELEAAPPVELLDRAVEAERPLLDQVEERHAEAAVALRDRDDEPEVRLDHPALRALVAALDRLREHDLLGGREQLVTADVGEEQLEAVAGAARAGARLQVQRLGRLLVLAPWQRRPRLPSTSRISSPSRSSSRFSSSSSTSDSSCSSANASSSAASTNPRSSDASDERPDVLGLQQLLQLVLRQEASTSFRCCIVRDNQTFAL